MGELFFESTVLLMKRKILGITQIKSMNLLKTLLIGSTATISALLTVTVMPADAQWIVQPTVFNNPFGNWGPDGIPGTPDDPPWIIGVSRGIVSGYTGGIYNRPPGRVPGEVGGQLTAAASLTSIVTPKANNRFDYSWTLTNNGSGDLVRYFDTNGGQLPNFITVLNNFGQPELDGAAGPPVDLTFAPVTETQTLLNAGPPTIGFWGGGWNPETETEAQFLKPIPEPTSTLGLLALGTLGAASTLKRKQKLFQSTNKELDKVA